MTLKFNLVGLHLNQFNLYFRIWSITFDSIFFFRLDLLSHEKFELKKRKILVSCSVTVKTVTAGKSNQPTTTTSEGLESIQLDNYFFFYRASSLFGKSKRTIL